MRALYWDGRELTFNSAYRAPDAGPRSALIKVHLAGICSTDLQIFKGYMSFEGVPGHEFVGSVSDGPGELIGKRVAGEINFGCGQCDACRRDLNRHCPNRGPPAPTPKLRPPLSPWTVCCCCRSHSMLTLQPEGQ